MYIAGLGMRLLYMYIAGLGMRLLYMYMAGLGMRLGMVARCKETMLKK